MTIPHLADQQNVVFVPALIALLIATTAICLPIVLAPALRRGRTGPRRAPIALAVLVAAAALVVTGWQAGLGARTLQSERSQLQADVQARYGIDLAPGAAGELINGGAPKQVLTAQATALRLQHPDEAHALRLKVAAAGSDDYLLTLAGRTLPTTG